MEVDGTFSLGYSYDSPYGTLWVTSSILPFLQVTGRYVSISGTHAFANPTGYWEGYGRYKDKVIDPKVKLWDETTWAPSVAVGVNDLFGTGLFKGQYVVATKTFGAAKNLELSLGYGRSRPDGVFGGVRWTPESLPNWSLVGEYDAIEYSRDYAAAETYAGQRRKGPSLGLEYRWGWLGVQAARHRDHSSINAFVSIPFSDREFVPKIFEPAYYQEKLPRQRVSREEWRHDASLGEALVQALASQDYKNIRVELKGHTLHLALTNARISNLGRAVGRAVRTALFFAPLDIRAIHVTYTKLEQPVATYEFFDLKKLNDYLDMRIDRAAFLDTVLVRYSNRNDVVDDQSGMLAGVKDESGLAVLLGQDGNVMQVSSEDREANRFKILPKLGFFFNDPSGAFRYELSAVTNYDQRLANGLYVNGAMGLTLAESVSGVTQASNSLLPHVRTDVAEYKRGGRLKLHRLLLNKYMMPDERWYARLSGGIYEEMYRGVGGQLLYLPKNSRWAADLSVDALQQRDYRGWFGKRDYNTITALGALHYRLPYDITATARVGRFLAKDVGVRAEFKRRFRSGIEVGAWYARTNGNDITSPGTPEAPYRDKGIFLSIPLGSMLGSDSQAVAGFAIAPWTRDVGQMVASPGDLYDLLENSRRDVTILDGLGNFAERADEQNHPAIDPPLETLDNAWPEVRRRVEHSASVLPSATDWAQGAGIAAGAILVASLSDKKIDQFAKNQADSRVMRGWDTVGNALPYALVGAAGAAFALGDNRMRNIGLISLQSVAAATGIAIGTKYLVGRSRPMEENGPWSQTAHSRSNASFPSGHATVAFAAVTPFAKEYDAPWLYAVAALGSAGRVAGRQHWASDAVAGGLLGYAVGAWVWQAQRDDSQARISVHTRPGEIGVSWHKSY